MDLFGVEERKEVNEVLKRAVCRLQPRRQRQGPGRPRTWSQRSALSRGCARPREQRIHGGGCGYGYFGFGFWR